MACSMPSYRKYDLRLPQETERIETWNFQHWLLSVAGQLLLSLPFLSQSMKARPAVALVTVVLVGSLAGFYLYDRFNGSSTPSCNDPASISSHVYHPYRLQIVKILYYCFWDSRPGDRGG